MAIDTLAYVKALEGAGVDRRVAEAHLKAMQDGVIIDLVTKRDLAAFEHRIDQRFTAVETRLDQRITAVETKLDQRITAVETKLDQRIAAVDNKLDVRSGALEAKIDKLEERIKGMIWQASLGILLGGLTIGGFLVRFIK